MKDVPSGTKLINKSGKVRFVIGFTGYGRHVVTSLYISGGNLDYLLKNEIEDWSFEEKPKKSYAYVGIGGEIRQFNQPNRVLTDNYKRDTDYDIEY